MADQPKARPRSRTRGQVTSNLQTDVSAEMPGHREVMPIDRRGLMTAAKRLARAVHELGPVHVVVTGGHRAEPTDVYFDGVSVTTEKLTVGCLLVSMPAMRAVPPAPAGATASSMHAAAPNAATSPLTGTLRRTRPHRTAA